MAIRLIGIDIDGTLLDSRWQLPAANRLAVERANARGVDVALVTGRRFDFARPVADQFAAPVTLIVNNGAMIKTRDGMTLARHLLPRHLARRVIEQTPRFRDGAAVVFDRPRERQVVFERIDWETPSRRTYAERNLAFIAEVEPLEDCLTEDPIQLMYNGTIAAMRELMGLLRGLSFGNEFSTAVTEYEKRDFSLVDVMCGGRSKGAGLREWVAMKGVERAEVMAIGDNLNDLDMLEFAGQPVVMGNAVPELKAFGWPTTRSNDEAGVAEAIERFALAVSPGHARG
jgi:Cof subfamily protein (haloacid dehalogenase superfamily)